MLFSTFGFAQDTLQQPLSFVQEMPTYIGGEDAMMQLIFDNVIYPEYEKSMNIQGSVYVKFIVEKDGTPTHFEVTKGVGDGPGLDSAALHACKQLGKFNPGTQNGVPQRVYLTIPIKFELDDLGDLNEALSTSELKQIQKDAELLCDLFFKMVAAEKSHDREKIKELSAEADHLTALIYANYTKGGVNAAKELQKLIEPCFELAMPIKFSLADDYEDPAQERLSRSDLKQIKKDGKYICDMMFQMIEAQRAGDQVKIEKLTAEFEKEAAILEKRYPKDSAREDRLEDIVQPCLEEAMKAAMGK